MKLTHLQHIAAIAEHGSLRAASRALGIAQPAITRSIREIEREVGAALFERQAKGTILTATGKMFLPRILAAQNELRRAREEIDQLQGTASGVVAVALSTLANVALLPHILESFRKRYPKVVITISGGLYPAIEGQLRSGVIDFYVGPLSETPRAREYSVEKLLSNNSRVVLGRKGHPLSGAKSLKALVGVGWITTSITNPAQAELKPLFDKYGLPSPHVALEATNALSAIVAAAHSDLLVMLPRQWQTFHLGQDLLQKIEVGEDLPAPPLCIVRRASLPLTPAAEYLCDLLRRAAGHSLTPKATKKRP